MATTDLLLVAALNYPLSRGTATAFPLAAFGLSAFLFSTVGTFAFHDDTSKLLLLLASGTVLFPIVSFPFLRFYPQQLYERLSTQNPLERSNSQAMHRTSSADAGRRRLTDSIGAQSTTSPLFRSNSEDDLEGRLEDDRSPSLSGKDHETSSLLSKSSASGPGVFSPPEPADSPDTNNDSPHLDIRGFALLSHIQFWQLFLMMGLITGIGLMTIKLVAFLPYSVTTNIISNIGNDTQALWKHYDASVEDSFIQRRQNIHVCIISFASFSGRLLSGIGSDLLVQKLNRSRFWCLFVSAFIFCVAQLCALLIEDPHLLVIVSGLTGLAYGLLFGVYPSLVAHTFGVHGLSTNWGTMTLAPVITGNVFNLLYGKIYDSHSTINDEGERECLDGRHCYATAYWVTLLAGIAGVLICLWSVWHEDRLHKSSEKSSKRTDHEREA